MTDPFVKMHISRIDKVDAAMVLLNPEIYDRISDDNSPPREEWELPDIDYWGGYIDGALASVNIEHDFRDGKKIHFQVLKPYRWAARELLNASLPEGRLYCQIPTCFMTTINFAKNQGFEVIEVSPRVYPKYGQLHDRILLRLDNECSS
jgi:hypothetical protein